MDSLSDFKSGPDSDSDIIEYSNIKYNSNFDSNL